MKFQECNNTCGQQTLLAAERTFSAWLRTALAATAGGLAILRLIAFKTDTHRIVAYVMGEMLILWGCIIIVLAALDYHTLRIKLLKTHKIKSSQIRYFLMIVPLLLISLLLVWVTLPKL